MVRSWVPLFSLAQKQKQKKSGQKVVHSNIDHFIIEGTYVNDIFVLFNSPEHQKLFQNYINFRHVNTSFTTENGKDNRVSFFNVNIIRRKVNLQLLSTGKRLLAELILILTVFFTIHQQNWHD